MGDFTIASIAAIFTFFGVFRAVFWVFSVDVAVLRSTFHRRRLLEALCAVDRRAGLDETATLTGILEALEWDHSLPKQVRSDIESSFSDYRLGAPILAQIDERVRRDRAHAIAAWSTIAPGFSTAQATTARRALEDEVLDTLAERSRIVPAGQLLRNHSGDADETAPQHTPEDIFSAFTADIADEPRMLPEAFRRGRPYLLRALANGVDVIGRGVTIGLLTGFALGFLLDQSAEQILETVAESSIIAAALLALCSTLFYAVKLYRAAEQERMKGPLVAALAYAVAVLCFIAELTYSFFSSL